MAEEQKKAAHTALDLRDKGQGSRFKEEQARAVQSSVGAKRGDCEERNKSSGSRGEIKTSYGERTKSDRQGERRTEGGSKEKKERWNNRPVLRRSFARQSYKGR